jgi:zinc-binding alcohol dehydrogenase family protein
MKCAAIFTPSPIESNPLKLIDLDVPVAGKGEVLVRVLACGVCRTDLHVSEGDLPPRHPRIVPGHEVVAVVERCGEEATRFKVGERVGIAWLRQTCGSCVYCIRGNENLCPNALFTGYDHDGGYAEYAVVREDFAYRLPQGLGVEETAPLLCAGIIGFRAMKRAGVKPSTTVGLYMASVGLSMSNGEAHREPPHLVASGDRATVAPEDVDIRSELQTRPYRPTIGYFIAVEMNALPSFDGWTFRVFPNLRIP